MINFLNDMFKRLVSFTHKQRIKTGKVRIRIVFGSSMRGVVNSPTLVSGTVQNSIIFSSLTDGTIPFIAGQIEDSIIFSSIVRGEMPFMVGYIKASSLMEGIIQHLVLAKGSINNAITVSSLVTGLIKPPVSIQGNVNSSIVSSSNVQGQYIDKIWTLLINNYSSLTYDDTTVFPNIDYQYRVTDSLQITSLSNPIRLNPSPVVGNVQNSISFTSNINGTEQGQVRLGPWFYDLALKYLEVDKVWTLLAANYLLNTYNDTAVIPEMNYQYRITDSKGTASLSNVVQFIT